MTVLVREQCPGTRYFMNMFQQTLFLDNVHNVVNGDPTDEFVLPVQHGQGTEIVLRGKSRDLFLVGIGVDRYGILVGQFLQRHIMVGFPQ